MAKKRLFVDMDGTLARFHDQVNYLERMFEKDFFLDLEPFENMVEGVRQFIQAHPDVEVYILSAKVIGEPPYCEGEKHAWLDMHLPEIPRERRIFTEMGRPKAEFIPGGLTDQDYLLDDYNKGLNQWLYDGGTAIKCHNNINQRGLGAYGGQAGNLWIGPMAHVDDEPEMICAELSSHMGLSYDLRAVKAAYPEISMDISKQAGKRLFALEDGTFRVHGVTPTGTESDIMTDPLNALRYLSGHADFAEQRLKLKDGETFNVPNFLLSAICANVFGSPDFSWLLQECPNDLARRVKRALEQADKPIVGRIHYLSMTGKVMESRNFFDFKSMEKEIDHCRYYGIPITTTYNITPPARTLHDMDFFDVESIFYYNLDLEEDLSADLAAALVTKPEDRSKEDILALASFWHHAPDELKDKVLSLLGKDAESHFLAGTTQFAEKPGLDVLIHHAENKANGAVKPQSPGPDSFKR